jgi:hypothetical protein
MATDDDRFEDDRDDRDYDDRPRRRERADYEQDHRGGLILALGIIGLVACGPVGIAAWVMGNNDMKEMEAGRMDPEGKQLTQVGKILGIVATIFTIIGFCAVIAYFVLIIGLIGAGVAK